MFCFIFAKSDQHPLCHDLAYNQWSARIVATPPTKWNWIPSGYTPCTWPSKSSASLTRRCYNQTARSKKRPLSRVWEPVVPSAWLFGSEASFASCEHVGGAPVANQWIVSGTMFCAVCSNHQKQGPQHVPCCLISPVSQEHSSSGGILLLWHLDRYDPLPYQQSGERGWSAGPCTGGGISTISLCWSRCCNSCA